MGQGRHLSALPRLSTVETHSDSSFVGLSAALFAHRFAFKLDAVGVMDQAVEDAIGNGGITDLLMPMGDRCLRGKDQRAALITVVADFEEITALAVFEWSHSKVIEQEDVGPGESQQHPADAAVYVGNRQFSKQLRRSFMQHGETVPASFLRQSAGQPAFADPSGAGHIVPTFRDPPRFTIGGAICLSRVSLFCAEYAVKRVIG